MVPTYFTIAYKNIIIFELRNHTLTRKLADNKVLYLINFNNNILLPTQIKFRL